MEMPNWIHKSVDIYHQAALNLETANRELALHDEGVYNIYRGALERGKEALKGRVPCNLQRRQEVLIDILKAEKAKAQRRLVQVKR